MVPIQPGAYMQPCYGAGQPTQIQYVQPSVPAQQHPAAMMVPAMHPQAMHPQAMSPMNPPGLVPTAGLQMMGQPIAIRRQDTAAGGLQMQPFNMQSNVADASSLAGLVTSVMASGMSIQVNINPHTGVQLISQPAVLHPPQHQPHVPAVEIHQVPGHAEQPPKTAEPPVDESANLAGAQSGLKRSAGLKAAPPSSKAKAKSLALRIGMTPNPKHKPHPKRAPMTCFLQPKQEDYDTAEEEQYPAVGAEFDIDEHPDSGSAAGADEAAGVGPGEEWDEQGQLYPNVPCRHPQCWKVANVSQRYGGFCCIACAKRYREWPTKRACQHGIYCTNQDYIDGPP